MQRDPGSSGGATGASGEQPTPGAEKTAAAATGSTSQTALQRALLANLTAASGGSGQPPPRGRLRRLTEVPYDPEPRREVTRSRLAYALVALLMLVALSIIFFLGVNMLNLDEAKEMAGLILSPIVGVTGAVFGFYYGGHRRGQ